MLYLTNTSVYFHALPSRNQYSNITIYNHPPKSIQHIQSVNPCKQNIPPSLFLFQHIIHLLKASDNPKTTPHNNPHYNSNLPRAQNRAMYKKTPIDIVQFLPCWYHSLTNNKALNIKKRKVLIPNCTNGVNLMKKR